MYEITLLMLNLSKDDYLTLTDSIITDDGIYLLMTLDYTIPRSKLSPGVKPEGVQSAFVFDLNKRKSYWEYFVFYIQL